MVTLEIYDKDVLFVDLKLKVMKCIPKAILNMPGSIAQLVACLTTDPVVVSANLSSAT